MVVESYLTRFRFMDVHFAESEIGFPGLAENWEKCASVRGRFRKEITWLQFPIPSGTEEKQDPTDEDGQAKDGRNPHAPSTRAMELNWEILSAMLDTYTGEFVDIDRLTKEAGIQE